MQPGLHIGLAAWINVQRRTNSFVVFPPAPIATTRIHLDAAQNPNDLARAAEFTRLVNFVPRQGQLADTFNTSTVLWALHLENLGRMDFATAAWTRVEREQFDAARSVLYTTDSAGMPVPSDRHLLYLELKAAYRDLEDTAASPQDMALALANWLSLGHKQTVEDALEAIGRLGVRSNLTRAENERISLQRTLDASGIEPPIAPTYFAPVSATIPETWMEANVSYDILERAVGKAPERAQWSAYRANRNGDVSFKYVALSCLRPWFSQALYAADDFRVREGHPPFSLGNGIDGQIPAYVSSVYLVKVQNLVSHPAPAVPVMPPIRGAPLAERPLQIADKPKSIGGKDLGVRRKARAALETVSGAETMEKTSAKRPVNPLQTSLSGSLRGAGNGDAGNVTTQELKRRYLLAQEYLVDRNRRRPASAEPPPTESMIYVAGFGCDKVPLSPNPNPNYQW